MPSSLSILEIIGLGSESWIQACHCQQFVRMELAWPSSDRIYHDSINASW
jgi:hypothetical protein